MSPKGWVPPAPADRERLPPEQVFDAGLLNHHISNTAYPIAHDRTFAPYRIREADQRAVIRDAFADIRDLGLYVHIPFCETRCAFCEYTVVRREESELAREYVDALLGELELWDAEIELGSRRFHGLDLGGGTPTFLPLEQIARVLEAVRRKVHFRSGDVSIETTPRIAAREPDKIAGLPRLGIDRISMGVQVSETKLLADLGRADNGVAEQRRAAENILGAGFRRFNVDLMYGFANQTLDGWRATLEHAIRLGPDAITLYRMRYKLTRISHQAGAVTLEHVRPLAELAKRVLGDAGFAANPGKTTLSRIPGDVGTSSYLAQRVRAGMPYLGLGLGAQSYSHTTLSYNDGAVGKNLTPYLRSVARGRLPLQDLYDLPLAHAMGKMCAVSFYFGEIDLAAFSAKFGLELEQAFPSEVAFAKGRGLMTQTARSLALTPLGAHSVNGVIALFFAPSIQRYLVERDPSAAGDFVRQRNLALRVAGPEAAGV